MRAFFTLVFLAYFGAMPVIAQQKPNIIFILTDDLGYGDVGVFFQNLRRKAADQAKPWHLTPHIDRMAGEGAVFTQMYCNAPVCAPSRASLLTGMHQGNAHVRDNQFDKALEDNLTIASVLKQAGYSTWAIGKWGLQGTDESVKPHWPAHPMKRGFDHFLGYMRHADGHEHYPAEGLYRGKKEVYEDYREISADLKHCYTTDLWTAAAKKQIIQHERTAPGKPFFLYLAYDTPHAVLELPAGPYPAGSGLRGGMQWTGRKDRMISSAGGKPDAYRYPEYVKARYDDDANPATAEKPWPDTYVRYAGSVRRIDEGIGDILALLRDLKIDDNTLVVFSSDNGPSIESYLPDIYVPYAPTFFGSSGPFDGIKRDVWEGGVRMPVIARWPSSVQKGRMITTPSMLSDWLATFADAAGLQVPARTDGVSLLPALTRTGQQKDSKIYIEYFQDGKTPDFPEFEASRRGRKRGQMQLLRIGEYAGVRYGVQSANDDFEIYNVVKDPKETHDLAKTGAGKPLQAEMKAGALRMHRPDAAAPRPYDTSLIPSVKPLSPPVAGIRYTFLPSGMPWLIQDQQNNNLRKSIVKTLKPDDAQQGTAVFEGYIRAPEDGAYTFQFHCAGKALVRLHQAILFDSGFSDAGTLSSGTICLKAGFHPVKIYTMVSQNKTQSPATFSWKDDHGNTGSDLYY